MNQEIKNHVRVKSNIYKLAQMAVMTAVICVLAPMAIPIGPVPISFTNLAILLALYILGTKMGTISFLCYLVLGTVGLPVFSGFTGGLGKLLGPTGGYLIGFIPLAIISGLSIEKLHNKFAQFLGMVAGVVVCYAFGTAWFCYLAGTGLQKALALCVIPFIPGDIAKILIAMVVGPVLVRALEKSQLI